MTTPLFCAELRRFLFFYRPTLSLTSAIEKRFFSALALTYRGLEMFTPSRVCTALAPTLYFIVIASAGLDLASLGEDFACATLAK